MRIPGDSLAPPRSNATPMSQRSSSSYQLLAELEQPRSPRRKLYQKFAQVRPYDIFKVISPPLMRFRDRLTDRSPKKPRVNP
jgi:hypothetical protein